MVATLTTTQIREEFVRSHIDGAPVTLKELARRHARSHDVLRQVASKDQWTKVATLACAERDAAAAKKIADQNALTACVLEQVVEREVDIRQRHARLARSLQQAAIERLMAIKPSELSPKLAIEMLRLGITVEREALGLGDVAPKLFDDAEDTLHVREAVQDAQEILARHAPSLRRESVPEYEKVAHNAATASLSTLDKDFSDCSQLQ